MRPLSVILLLALLFSCKKKDANEPPPPPVTISEKALEVSTFRRTDVDEVDVSCQVSPASGEVYAGVWLHWSTSPDFMQEKDSLLVDDTIAQVLTKVMPVRGLKQATRYHFRITLTYKNNHFFSPARVWTTDSAQVTNVNYNPDAYVNRGDTTGLLTNFAHAQHGDAPDTRIMLGSYECPIVGDNGFHISFGVPATIPYGKYRLELRRKGFTTWFRDSVEVLRGHWNRLPSPDFPLSTTAAATGFIHFGTAHSSDKGWLVGGSYFNSAPDESNYNRYLYEFDPQQQRWTRRVPANQRLIDYPVCYYYNNSIYVISGIETILSADGTQWLNYRTLKTMKRLDLGSLTWYDMDSLPYRNFTGMPSFVYQSEFYIGMGSNGDSVSQCCSRPLPSKKFWKYNPATNQWTRLADFPGGHQDNPTLFTIGTKAYAWYGAIPVGDPFITTSFTQEFWEYNIPANVWKPLSLPELGGPQVGEKYTVIAHNGKAYFITAQTRTLFGNGYGYLLQNISLEWDPVTGLFKKVSYPKYSGIFKLVYSSGNRFYFHTDAIGYIESLPNYTYSFTAE